MSYSPLLTSLPIDRLSNPKSRSALRQLIDKNSGDMAFVVEGPRLERSDLKELEGIVDTFDENKPIEPGKIYHAQPGESLSLESGTIHAHARVHQGKLKKAVCNQLLDYSQEALSIISPEGKPVYVSKASEAIFGCTLQEIYEMGLMDVVHPLDQQHVNTVLNKALKQPGKTIPGGAVRVKRKNGEWRWCEANITNMLHDPDIGGIIDSFRDVTELIEQKNASSLAQKNTAALINSTADAMWSVDENYKLTHANHSFEIKVSRSKGIAHIASVDVLSCLAHTASERSMWKINYEAAFDGKKVNFVYKWVEFGTGEQRWYEVNLTPIATGGKIRGVAGSMHDITSMKTHTARLEALNEKLLISQRLAKLGYWELDIATRKLDWSDELKSIWGWEDAERPYTFEILRESVHPDDKQIFDARFAQALSDKGIFELTHRLCRADGEVRWVKQLGMMEADYAGNPLRLRGACQDVTLEKETEKELEKRNAFIETAMDNLPIGIAVNEMEKGEATFINKMFAQAYGWPKHMLKNREEFFRLIYPDKAYREEMVQRIMTDIKSGDPENMSWKEVTVTGQDGKERQVNAQNIPLPEQGLMISTAMDVTREVKSRKDLKLSNDRYKYSSKASFDAIWDYDVKNDTLYWGDGFKDNFGHSYKKNISHFRDWARLVHPDDHGRVVRSIEEALAHPKKKVWSCGYRMQRADGTYAHVSDRGYILRDAEKRAYRLIGALQDVSKAKEEEANLRLRDSVIASAKEGIIISEIDEKEPLTDRIVSVNDALNEILKVTADEVIGQPTDSLLAPYGDSLALKNVQKARLKAQSIAFEMKNGSKPEGVNWISCSMNPVPDSQGKMTHWVTFIRDITEQRNYVNILQKQNQRLREIAFTQSHLVRTPLSRLLGLVHLLNETQREDPDFDKIIDNVKSSAHELDQIIKSIVLKTSISMSQTAMEKDK